MQQELQNWTGGPKDQCKLIGIKSRFALIDRKAQEQKNMEILGILKISKEKNVKIHLCAQFLNS